YVFSVLDYGCETWTWNSPMRLKVNAFEMWCYRMILGISWRDKVSNKKVMIRVQTELQTELHFTKDMIKRKLEYAGHVLRGSSGLSHLQILEGKLEGKKKVGCPIRIWMNDICDWSLLGTRVATGLLKPNSLTFPGFSRFFQAHFSQHFISFAVHKIAIVRYADVNSLYGTVL